MASANVGAPSGGGKRRSLDAEINLVPFIDLLSMCICFLLITAVWIQVGSVQVKQSKGTEAAAPAKDQMEMEVHFKASQQLELSFKKAGKTVKKQVAAASSAELMKSLDLSLSGWPETKDGSKISSALITPKAGVPYGDLVSVMDVLRKHQIVNLGVVPTGAGGA
jgi:biopolymer transport protein TolR